LQILLLWETKITDSGLKSIERLSRLTHLDLSGTAITDRGLWRLKSMSALKDLGLSRTNVTAAGVAELQKSLPNCTIEAP